MCLFNYAFMIFCSRVLIFISFYIMSGLLGYIFLRLINGDGHYIISVSSLCCVMRVYQISKYLQTVIKTRYIFLVWTINRWNFPCLHKKNEMLHQMISGNALIKAMYIHIFLLSIYFFLSIHFFHKMCHICQFTFFTKCVIFNICLFFFFLYFLLVRFCSYSHWP